jgi:hypothetical protein
MKRAIACLIVAIVGLRAATATAGDCCNDCGCQCKCCKVCRCVPVVKKVPKITYCCEQEDFCIPGHSKICGYKCTCPDDCDCGCKLFHHAHKEPIWQPTCAKVHTRNVLVKKEEMKEECSWKWEVVYLCPQCSDCKHHGRCRLFADQTQPGAEPAQALADKSAVDYYSQDEDAKPAAQSPVTQPAAAQENQPQQAELVSHSVPSKLKQVLLPLLGK